MPHNYLVTVEDFGPITSAAVELRPLTVFVGPSNTGKSYLAGLLYALHRTFGDSILGPGYPRTVAPFRYPPLAAPRVQRLSPDLRNAIHAWASSCADSTDTDGRAPPLPPQVVSRIRRTLEHSDVFQSALTDEVVRCFGIEDPSDLTRRSSDSSSPSVKLHMPISARDEFADIEVVLGSPDHSSVRLEFDSLGFRARSARHFITRATQIDDDPDDPFAERLDPRRLLNSLVTAAFSTVFAPIARNRAYYLPADRTGVMHSHHVVVSALFQRASYAGIRPVDDVPMLSGVMADFLDVLVTRISQLERRRRRNSRIADAARSFEHKILDGSVRVDLGEVGYPSFAYRPVGWKEDLPLMRASSMVSELAPIVLYLRHVVRPGDLLIVEEPESHLHPAKQAALALHLGALVERGVRIVITTHSEWFLEQIGNMVRASGLPADKRDGLPQVLDPDQVGAWLFTPEGRTGSVVEEVVLDADTGLYPTGYDAVSETLYNESAKIFNRLQTSETEE